MPFVTTTLVRSKCGQDREAGAARYMAECQSAGERGFGVLGGVFGRDDLDCSVSSFTKCQLSRYLERGGQQL
jgi:hypothetical protein